LFLALISLYGLLFFMDGCLHRWRWLAWLSDWVAWNELLLRILEGAGVWWTGMGWDGMVNIPGLASQRLPLLVRVYDIYISITHGYGENHIFGSCNNLA
jgi:hypothetical protein